MDLPSLPGSGLGMGVGGINPLPRPHWDSWASRLQVCVQSVTKIRQPDSDKRVCFLKQVSLPNLFTFSLVSCHKDALPKKTFKPSLVNWTLSGRSALDENL